MQTADLEVFAIFPAVHGRQMEAPAEAKNPASLNRIQIKKIGTS